MAVSVLSDEQALAYIASYGDLIRAFGVDAEAGRQHYATRGMAEGRGILFDGTGYLASNRDLITALGTSAATATVHYIRYGATEGRATTFDATSYLAANRDVLAVFGSNTAAATRHYVDFGSREGRPTTFDGYSYLAVNRDVLAVYGNDPAAAARHYVQYGAREGRPTVFDATSYLAANRDVLVAFGTDTAAATRHYVEYGSREGRSTTFDGLNYLAANGDLITVFGTDTPAATRHFVQYGAREGRPTSFDAITYLLGNDDLLAAGFGAQGALRHYVANGFREGRGATGAFGNEQTDHLLSITHTGTGRIDAAGDRDWFQIDVSGERAIRLELGMRGGTGSFLVYDTSGRRVATDGSGVVGQGSYYVVVAGAEGAAYTLNALRYVKTIVGTTSSDTLTGTDGADLIQGLDGSDTLIGRAGNDVLEGGAGADQLDGGLGDDVLYGNNAANSGLDFSYDSLVDDAGGNDQLFGQDGNDYLQVSRQQPGISASTVLLDGGSGNDTINFYSSRFLDSVTIRGGLGNDTIGIGAVLSSVIDAGDGNDQITIGMSGGDQTITLGAGADVLVLEGQSYAFAVGNPTRITDFAIGIDTLNMDQYLANVLLNWNRTSNPFGTGHLKLVQSGRDTLLQLDRDGSAGSGYGLSTLLTLVNTTASAFTARDLGFAPDGTVTPGRTIVGTSGNDTLNGTDGADVLRGLNGGDTLNGRAGDDVLEGGTGSDTLNGGLGDDVLYGNNADNSGGDFSYDSLTDDQGGNDQLFGQDGGDYLSVSRYDYSGSISASTLLLDGGSGNDTITFYSSRVADVVTIRGGLGNDVIEVGSVLRSMIDAGDGDDAVTIDTRGGNQTITLGAGADILTLRGFATEFSIGNPIRITDFVTGTDMLDMDQYLANVLINWDWAANPFGTGHLRLVQSDRDTVLLLDRDGGSGTGYGFAPLLTFAGIDAAALSTQDLGFAPDGGITVGQTIIGTSGNDTIRGTNGNDLLRGLDGNDTLNGRGGNDLLEGGAGGDTLTGGYGNDVLYGNNAGNVGTDFGFDFLSDDAGGNDRLYGQDGNDFLTVSRYIFGSSPVPASTVLLDGGSGDDTINFSSGRFIDTVTVSGGLGNDTIRVGSVLKAVIDAGDGNDKVTIGMSGGDQTITLGAGADILTLDGLTAGFAIGNPTRITDFTVGTDILSMDQYLANTLLGWDKTSNPFGTGHLKLVQSGNDTLLQLDRDGTSGTGYGLATLLTFADTRADTFSAKDLGFAPDYHTAAPTFAASAWGASYLGEFLIA